MKITLINDILDRLKKAGFSTYRLRKESLICAPSIQRIKAGEPVSFGTVATICELLQCQPADILAVERIKAK